MALTAGAAGAQDSAPQLMLDTGGHTAIINSLVFSSDGKQLISAADDKVIRVWDWQAGNTVRTIRGQVGLGDEGKIYAAALSRDGRWLAAGGWTHKECAGRCGEIRLYEFSTGNLVALLKGHENVVLGLAFSPDGKRLVSGSFDKTAIIWDVANHKLVHRLQGHKDHIYAVGFTPDSARVVTGSYDTTLKLWTAQDGKEIATLTGHKSEVRSLAISPLDGTIASGSSREVRLWDGMSGRYLRTIANQSAQVSALSFSPDGKWLVSGNGALLGPFPVRVWEVATGKKITEYDGHDNVVIATAVSPDGRLVATGGFNGDIQIWDARTGETKKLLAGTGAPSWAAGISADGRGIAWGNTWLSAPGRQSHPSELTSPLQFQLQLPDRGRGSADPNELTRPLRRASSGPASPPEGTCSPTARVATMGTMKPSST